MNRIPKSFISTIITKALWTYIQQELQKKTIQVHTNNFNFINTAIKIHVDYKPV